MSGDDPKPPRPAAPAPPRRPAPAAGPTPPGRPAPAPYASPSARTTPAPGPSSPSPRPATSPRPAPRPAARPAAPAKTLAKPAPLKRPVRRRPPPPPEPASPAVTLGDLAHHPLVERARQLSRRLGLWAIGHFLDDALRSLWRTRGFSAFTIALIGLSLATVGSFVLVAENLGSLVDRLSSVEVSVYIGDRAAPAEIAAARTAIAALPGVTAIRSVSKDEALRLFRLENPDLAALPDALGENPFPASLEVSFAEGARTAEALGDFAARVEKLPGVAHVSRDLELASRILAASRLVKVVAAFLGGVLLLAALFTVSTVVKLTVLARRDEVAILRLVGATGAYVRGAFVTEGLIQGLLGAVVGLLLLALGYRLAGGHLAESGIPALASLVTRFLSAGSAFLLLLAGALLGAVGSLVPLGRLR